jgi:hypothetical protein
MYVLTSCTTYQPIQRLPRYELLLRDLAKHTAESGVEHEKLQKVRSSSVAVDVCAVFSGAQLFPFFYRHQLLKDVQKVNQHINEAKRKDENTNKLVEIQNAIKTKGDKSFTLFDRVGRQFVREGKLETRELQTDPTKKIPGFARGYVFLFNDLLVVTKQEKGGADAPRTYRLVEVYTLSGFTASSHFEIASAGEAEEKEKDRIISLVSIEKDGRTIQLKAHSASDRQSWLEDISKYEPRSVFVRMCTGINHTLISAKAHPTCAAESPRLRDAHRPTESYVLDERSAC